MPYLCRCRRPERGHRPEDDAGTDGTMKTSSTGLCCRTERDADVVRTRRRGTERNRGLLMMLESERGAAPVGDGLVPARGVEKRAVSSDWTA